MKAALFFVAALLFVGFAVEPQWEFKPETHQEHFESGEETQLKDLWQRWKEAFNKTYQNDDEHNHRYQVWKENSHMIYQHNTHQSRGNRTYTLGMNHFGDLNPDEFRLHVHGDSESCLLPGVRSIPQQEYAQPGEDVPASVDWSETNCGSTKCVSEVKNQGRCGSCWAFSTTGSIEARYAIKHHEMNLLSEQELVDCSRNYGNLGCNGGLMDNGFKYVEAMKGLCSESEYPYTAKDGTCASSRCSRRYDAISGYQDVSRDSSSSLEAAVAQGPVSIAVEADQSAFQFYSGGVMTGTCGDKLDHGVLVVGYGTSGGTQFWKVKNSWGATWGSQGYLEICRNCGKNRGEGECGILGQPSYPIDE